jgi:hypothetical protein
MTKHETFVVGRNLDPSPTFVGKLRSIKGSQLLHALPLLVKAAPVCKCLTVALSVAGID